MFNVECIVKPSILKATLLDDVTSNTLVFVKSKDMSLLYNDVPPSSLLDSKESNYVKERK
jgi:hypothetical protein